MANVELIQLKSFEKRKNVKNFYKMFKKNLKLKN